MKNNVIKNNYEAFSRIVGFKTRHGAALAAGSRGATLLTALAGTVTEMQKQGADQLSGEGEYHGGTSSKQFWFGEVKEDLQEIRDTAVSIAEAQDTPDFEDSFRMPRGSGYGTMTTAARAFLQDATPHKVLFIEFELPADFLEDLADDLAKFEAAEDSQDAGQAGRVGGTANLADLSTEG